MERNKGYFMPGKATIQGNFNPSRSTSTNDRTIDVRVMVVFKNVSKGYLPDYNAQVTVQGPNSRATEYCRSGSNTHCAALGAVRSLFKNVRLEKPGRS